MLIILIIGCYLLGSISGSVVLGKIKRIDIRKQGRGNAGATNAQYLARESGNVSDECCAGELHLFNPGSSSYFKQFYAFTDNAYNAAYIMASYIGGYARVFTPINAIKFTASSGTFNGTIKMYGIK